MPNMKGDKNMYKSSFQINSNHSWTTHRDKKSKKIAGIKQLTTNSKIIPTNKIVEVLESLISPGDRVALEGDNQKQASFLSTALSEVNPKRINDLHMVMPSISRPEHLDLFQKGIAKILDFSFSGNQSLRIGQMIQDGIIQVGSINTYIELYARLFVDLVPHIALVAAEEADADGNLYTGANTEETPVIVEATAFHDGIVIAQVNKIVDKVSRVDIPGSWVDFVVEADKPFQIEPLFTRDPGNITEIQILMAMLTIRGVYERHDVTSLNHGIGFNTAAIELLLPTYGESLGLKGRICKYWALNPQPTLIPAIESGWVSGVHCFGGELGMEKYVAARPDIFFIGSDGTLRSNRAYCQMAGQYATDLFAGSTLQMDREANSSTVTLGRLSGFGGAPNMGSDPHGRRHSSPAWLSLAKGVSQTGITKGQKLVVQIVETFQQGNSPVFVDSLDAIQVGKDAKLPLAPVMIYGDDVTHVVTEEGVAYLYKAQNIDERKQALAAIAGVTPVGMSITSSKIKTLRKKGIVAYPEDLKVNRTEAKRSLLAAKSIEDLVDWSGGLYEPPAKFKTY